MGIIDYRTIGLLAAFTCMAGIPMHSAAEDRGGEIVVHREVQPRIATRPTMVPDPNPVTVNANRSDDVTRLTGELSDTDYANVTSGSSLQRQIMPGGHLLGMDNSATQGLSGNNGLGAQGGSTSGSGISNTVNRGLQQGLAPLRILTGGSR